MRRSPARRLIAPVLALALASAAPTGRAAALDPPPVAPPDRPARDPFLSRWQRATADVVDENVWFRDLSAQLDVRWRAEQLWLSPAPSSALRDRALEQAVAGTYLGWDRALRDWARGHEALAAASGWSSALLRPAVRMEARPEGRQRAAPDEAAARNGAAARAAIDQGAGPGRAPALQLGSLITLVELPTEATALTTAQGPALRASAATYLQGWAVGVDAARLEARVRAAPRPLARPPALDLRAIAREGVGPRAAVLAEAQLEPQRPRRTAALRAAAEWRVIATEPWWLRATLSQRPSGSPAGPVQQIELGLRANLGWRAPQHVDRWTLGQQPLAPPSAVLSAWPEAPAPPRPPPARPEARHSDPPPAPEPAPLALDLADTA